MRILLLLCILLSPLTIFAETETPLHWYNIELIIFSQLQPKSLTSESWPAVNNPTIPENSIRLTANPDASTQQLPDNIQLLQPQQWRLKQQQAALNRNQNYKTLLHLSWNEGFERYHKTVPFYLHTEQLSGLMSLTMRRYFELKTDFIYQIPADQLAEYTDLNQYNGHNINDNNIASFEIMLSRRLRSREFNYLDHPVVGMVIDILPIKAPNLA